MDKMEIKNVAPYHQLLNIEAAILVISTTWKNLAFPLRILRRENHFSHYLLQSFAKFFGKFPKNKYMLWFGFKTNIMLTPNVIPLPPHRHKLNHQLSKELWMLEFESIYKLLQYLTCSPTSTDRIHKPITAVNKWPSVIVDN